ncbi:MAG TPA: CAP domain-containing protein [Pyrinomonadaceae bacterium]|jgi:uncharacterized protein YkwD|nr:CAP domain-containing protein [Pyrinomonadaceae bacterium]
MRFPAILLLLFLFSPIIAAQTPQIIPTARLLTMPRDVSTASRPRRVSVPVTTTVLAPVDPNEIERNAFENTNAVRVRSGLAPLVWDAALLRAARVHSEDMVRQGYFAHETPDGARLRDRVRAVGILHFKVLGENIAYNQGFDDPGAFAVERWMLSPGHRANILSSEFELSAVGTFVAPDGTVYLTQVFLKR